MALRISEKDADKNQLYYENLSCIGNWAAALVEVFPDVAHLKSAKTKQYIQSNFHFAKYIGLESTDDLVGLTASDLVSIDGPFKCEADAASFHRWWEWKLALNENLEHQALSTQRPISAKSVSITCKGFIRLDEMTKLPVLSADNKQVIAILNLGWDLTASYSTASLFKVYQRFYPEQQAIQLFLRYLKIEPYFIERPTRQELQILLAMCLDPRHKCTAKLLGLAPGTVEAYLSKLRSKLTINLQAVLVHLRKIPVKTNDEVNTNEHI